MPIQPDERYTVKVTDAYITESKEKGTLGLFMSYEGEDGSIDHTWWITSGTHEFLKESLQKCFSITEKQLLDMGFLEGIGKFLAGKEVSIVTEDKEYNGKHFVAVKWMNPAGFRPKAVEKTGVERAARIFGGGTVSAPRVLGAPARQQQSRDSGPPPQAPIYEDVPF